MEKHQPITKLEDPHPLTTVKKTFFYNLIPSKLEEEQCKKTNMAYQVTKSLTEIRDVYPPPVYNAANPWRIRKILTIVEVVGGKIFIPHNEAFEHVFRFWSLEVSNLAVMGHKLRVVFWDFTEESRPVSVCSENCVFEKRYDDEGYTLEISDLVTSRSLNLGDEIGLDWDAMSGAFLFKLLRRGLSQTSAVVGSSATFC